MSWFHLCRFSKSESREHRHATIGSDISPCLSGSPPPEPSVPKSLLSSVVCAPELESRSVSRTRPQSSPTFLNWETMHERTTATPIINGREHQGRLHVRPKSSSRVAQHPSNICTTQKLHLVSLIPHHRETDLSRHLSAIGRHWKGPSTSLGIQEISSPDRPVAVGLEQASSFITEARERWSPLGLDGQR